MCGKVFAEELTDEVVVEVENEVEVDVDVESPPLAVLITSLPGTFTYAQTPLGALPQLSAG